MIDDPEIDLENQVSGKVYDGVMVRRLAGYVRPYWLLILAGTGLLIVFTGLQLAGPLILKEAIDGPVSRGETGGLGLLTALYLGVLVATFIVNYIQSALNTYVGQRVMTDLRTELFEHLQTLSVAFFDRNPVGRLVTRVTNDVATLEQLVSQGLAQILANLLSVIAVTIAMLILDWKLALVLLVTLPPLMWAVQFFALTQRDGYREQRAWLSRINADLNENISGMAVVQLFNREEENLRKFDRRNSGLLGANLMVLRWYAIFEPTVVLFGAVTTAAILVYGGDRVLDQSLTIGTLVAFTQYMQRFYWPIRDLSDRYTTLQSAMASSERIFQVLDEQPEVVDRPGASPVTTIRGEIAFDHVWFAYDEGNWVLRDLSFTIAPGERVAVVGSTGAGKSTIIGLLGRMYDVQKGAIRVDGRDIRDFPQRDLRRHVGVVLQDAFLFTDTVAENIRMRDRSISLDEVRAAAELVGADRFIAQLPDGYETKLAERGANLSTGQKQLIALARVAAFNPEIVLVMDEATASIDPETEALLQASIARVTSGRTSIIIAHRLNTIRSVDRILVMQHGQLLEQGSHRELLAAGGMYAGLFQLQYKGQDLSGLSPASGS